MRKDMKKLTMEEMIEKVDAAKKANPLDLSSDQKILAMKEYTRARNSKKAKLTKAKQELLSFMLRTRCRGPMTPALP